MSNVEQRVIQYRRQSGLTIDFGKDSVTGHNDTMLTERILVSDEVQVTELKPENKDLNGRLLAVEVRNTPITIREVMRILERSLCLEAVCSKSKFKRFFNIDKIKNSTDSFRNGTWAKIIWMQLPT